MLRVSSEAERSCRSRCFLESVLARRPSGLLSRDPAFSMTDEMSPGCHSSSPLAVPSPRRFRRRRRHITTPHYITADIVMEIDDRQRPNLNLHGSVAPSASITNTEDFRCNASAGGGKTPTRGMVERGVHRRCVEQRQRRIAPFWAGITKTARPWCRLDWPTTFLCPLQVPTTKGKGCRC